MGQGEDDIGVHDRLADLGAGDVFPVHRNLHVVGALDAVADDDVAARIVGVEAVLVGGLQMIEAVLAAADVQGVAVHEEGPPAQVADDIHQHPGIVGPQVGQIAGLAEVHLDGDVLVLEINFVDPRRQDQTRELLDLVLLERGVKIGKIYL